jgi:hypothetical protein
MNQTHPYTLNQALLARQAWHLLKYLNSLCACLLKAKYFPNGHLLDFFLDHGHLIDTVFPCNTRAVSEQGRDWLPHRAQKIGAPKSHFSLLTR